MVAFSGCIEREDGDGRSVRFLVCGMDGQRDVEMEMETYFGIKFVLRQSVQSLLLCTPQLSVTSPPLYEKISTKESSRLKRLTPLKLILIFLLKA